MAQPSPTRIEPDGSEARRLLLAELEKSPLSYYFMSGLARMAENARLSELCEQQAKDSIARTNCESLAAP